MKVFAFSGNPKRDASVGNKFLTMIKKRLKEMDPEKEFNIFIGSECDIKETDGSGNELVNKYLCSMMEYMGLLVLGKTSLETTKIEPDEVLESYVQFVCNKILLNEMAVIVKPITQEQNFEIQKKNYFKKTGGFVRDYWEQHSYFEMKSYEELFRSRLRKIDG